MVSQLQKLRFIRPSRLLRHGSKLKLLKLNILQDLSEDIIRFMDSKKITYATIGGHGFGAKVAAATAINNLNRFTGVI